MSRDSGPKGFWIPPLIQSSEMIQPEDIFIFTGPTLSPETALKTLDGVYLPPVKLGDVYQVCELYSPRVIGIIDGYFNQVPAVWHKEILYAISQGIHVYGAASMGALRAAELSPLGMIGCGKIFEAYHHGILAPFDDEVFEDDDEVALIHGPAELNYLAVSDALINIRFTLADAMHKNIVDLEVGRQLAGIAKRLFYAKRTYSTLLEIAEQQSIPRVQLTALRDWLQSNKIDQKQRDAITLLKTINNTVNLPEASRKSDALSFECTSQWQSAIDEIERSSFPADPVINELRLLGEAYFNTLSEAHARTETESSEPEFMAHSSPDPKTLTKWHQSPEKLKRHLSSLWQRKQANGQSNSSMHTRQRLLQFLKYSGKLSDLEMRAKNKQTVLDQLQQKPNVDELSELDRLQLCDWYFSTRLNSQIPDHMQKYVMELGLDDDNDFYAMLLAEYLYIDSS